jgi:hypothetical protein
VTEKQSTGLDQQNDFDPLTFFPPHLMDSMIRSFTAETPLKEEQNVLTIARVKNAAILTPLIAIERLTLTVDKHFAPLEGFRAMIGDLRLMEVRNELS